VLSVNHPKPTKGLDGLTECNWCGDPSRGETSLQSSSRMNLLALPFSDITQCGRSWQGTNRSEQGALSVILSREDLLLSAVVYLIIKVKVRIHAWLCDVPSTFTQPNHRIIQLPPIVPVGHAYSPLFHLLPSLETIICFLFSRCITFVMHVRYWLCLDT
jgi:hypothetical protein